MNFIKKINAIIAYKKQIELHLKALETTDSFTAEDKKFFIELYNKMLTRFENRVIIIAKDINVLQLKKN